MTVRYFSIFIVIVMLLLLDGDYYCSSGRVHNPPSDHGRVPHSCVSPKLCFLSFFPVGHPGNYYGTPKPPAEPSPVQPDPVDQVLFDEEFDTVVQRKRTPSVSKMDRKDSAAAPEEEEEEEQQQQQRPATMVNGVSGEGHVIYLRRGGCQTHMRTRPNAA